MVTKFKPLAHDIPTQFLTIGIPLAKKRGCSLCGTAISISLALTTVERRQSVSVSVAR